MPDDREPLSTILDWDSDFFGFKVAKICSPNLNHIQLQRALEELKKYDVKLVYWPADLSVESKQAAIKNKGIYVDRKIVYVKNLEDWKSVGQVKSRKYLGYSVSEDIIDLSIQSSVHSRFRVDPYIPDSKCDELYTEWIIKSLGGEMGDAIFSYWGDNKVAGIATIGKSNDRADIGIVAVDFDYRGKGIGVDLVNSVCSRSWIFGYNLIQVVTQGNNIGARKLYEKCGFKVDTIEEFYHFWL